MIEINQKDAKIESRKLIVKIGINIKKIRTIRGYTQQQLAFGILTDKCIISKIENGKCDNITVCTLIKISKVLEVEIRELID